MSLANWLRKDDEGLTCWNLQPAFTLHILPISCLPPNQKSEESPNLSKLTELLFDVIF